jgi:hypothetical protein
MIHGGSSNLQGKHGTPSHDVGGEQGSGGRDSTASSFKERYENETKNVAAIESALTVSANPGY